MLKFNSTLESSYHFQLARFGVAWTAPFWTRRWCDAYKMSERLKLVAKLVYAILA